MNPFLREKRDGTRGPGYLVYLGAGMAAVAAILVLHRRVSAPAVPAPVRRRASASVGAITQPAAMMSPVVIAERPPAGSTRSFRLNREPRARRPAAEAPASPAPFDPIDAALTQAPPPVAAAAPESAFAALPPSFAPGRPGAAGDAKSERVPQLLGYRDRSADPAAEARPVPAASPGIEITGPDIVPRGTLIPAVLLTTVDTGNPSAVLQYGVARSVAFHRRRQLEFGTRILGRLSGRPMRNRLDLTADTLLFPSGTEGPISATAVEADASGANIRPGIPAFYFPPPGWVQLAPYFSEAFSGFMGLLESRAQSQFSLGVGGLSLQASNPAGVRAPLYQASSQAMQDFSLARLKEVEERYASYFLVPAGTQFWLQLENDLDLGRVHGR